MDEVFLVRKVVVDSSFNLFKNVCERSWRYLQPIARKEDLISMYQGTVSSGDVNISVYFNK